MIPKFSSEEEAEKFFAENEKSTTPGSIADEDGDVTIIELEDKRYEVVDSVIYDGKLYVAIIPYDEDALADDEEETEFTILEVIDDPDDEDNCIMRTVDDDDLYTKIGDRFIERFNSDYDEEE